MKRKTITPKAGDVFAVPLIDGTFGLGHIIDVDKYLGPFALFGRRASSPSELASDLDHALKAPLTILLLTSNALKSGEWPVIDHKEPEYSAFAMPIDLKDPSYTFGIAPDFLNAYHGLIPWDGMVDPRWYEKLLIPGVPIPPTVRYKRDFAAGASTPPADAKPAPVTEGPAEVHIQIVYPGTGYPSVDLVRQRQAFERHLEEAGAGEVEGAESGDGVMEIFLRTDDVQRATPLIEQLLKEHGFQDDALIEAMPSDEEDEEEDDEEDDDC